MSTPVSQLPNNPGLQSQPTPPIPDDPEVMNVLKEMEEEVQSATRVHHQPQQPLHVPSPVIQHVQLPQPQLQQLPPKQTSIVNFEVLQKTAIIAVIAVAAFYPNILDPIYAMSPHLEQVAKFDVLVRAALLIVILYIATTQFGL
jgi:hypothetical protein